MRQSDGTTPPPLGRLSVDRPVLPAWFRGNRRDPGTISAKRQESRLEDRSALLGGDPMQPLPPQLELPEGDRFTLPTVSAVRELVPPGGQLPAHMVLMMICGKELWVPLDREIARQMAKILAPFRE